MSQLKSLYAALNSLATTERAVGSQRFFKTGAGQYGEGDVFIGVSMPDQRSLVKTYKTLSFSDLQQLIASKIHEHRMMALLILNEKIKSKDLMEQQATFDFYCSNFEHINNWDLVDCSCHEVIGRFLMDKDRSILKEWAVSEHLWTQRIAMVSTWRFIREKQVKDTLEIAEILLHHKHDLIHKATGWMLREAHKKIPTAIEDFLEKHHQNMPRTALRYAIERFSADKKAYFMTKY
jgi:3-methyladenine DNA glycosylase AlkD